MKQFFSLILLFIAIAAHGQKRLEFPDGVWIKCKATYANGDSLEDSHRLKFSYFKYTFEKSKVFISTLYHEQGNEFLYDVANDILTIKNTGGYEINQLHIRSVKDTLVLLQPGQFGLNDPSTIRLYFVPEKDYQSAIPLTPDDVLSSVNGDTIYKQSPKIYARFGGSGFHEYITAGIREKISMDGRSGQFAASFIISKAGLADSVKIIEGIDNKFDKQFLKVFNQAKKKWQPAILNNKPVNVQTTITLRYLTFEEASHAVLFWESKGNRALENKQYDIALYYYDQLLEKDPLNNRVLYKRGLCKKLMGNKEGACRDWLKSQSTGDNPEVTAAIKSYCQ